MRKLLGSLLVLVLLSSCSENYGTGERIGVITRFSRSGLIFKSWEGELHVTQTGMNSTMHDFDFSIDNNIEQERVQVINDLDSAAKNGWKVRIIYHEVKAKNITSSRGDTDYFVDSVQVLDKNMNNLFNNKATAGVPTGGVIDTIYVVIVPRELIPSIPAKATPPQGDRTFFKPLPKPNK